MKRFLTGIFAALLSATAFGTTFTPIQLLNPAGSSAGQAIVSTGPTTVAAWGGIGVNGITALAANTVIANATGSSASPTAVSMPSCSSTTSALQWTSGTGFVCNAGAAPLSSPALIGIPTAPNATAGANTTQIATTAFVEGSLQSPQVGIGSTAPNSGAFTTLSATGLISPASTIGIKGTTTNDNAQAGSVGEYGTASGGLTAASNGVSLNAASIPLSAGDWDVWGVCQFAPAGTITLYLAGINTVSATRPAGVGAEQVFTFSTPSAQVISTPVQRVSLSASGNAYLVVMSQFSSTLNVTGTIYARRVR